MVVVAKMLQILRCIPMISIENVCYFCDLNRLQTDLVDVYWAVFNRCSSTIDKNLQNQEMTVCFMFKVSNVNIFYDRGDHSHGQTY